MRLAEQKVLSLDDPLSRWVPKFPGAGRITVRQLLAQTSGLPAPDGLAMRVDVESFPRRARGPDAWRAFVPDRRGTPGTLPGEYSNANYHLLGDVIRAATRRSVADALERLVHAPAGVSKGAIVLQPDRAPSGHVAHGYQSGDNPRDLSDGSPYLPNKAWASVLGTAGGAAATPTALVQWWDAVLQGRVVSQESLEQMQAWHQLVADRGQAHEGEVTYGLGVSRSDTPVGDAIGHLGDIPGYQALLLHYSDVDITVAFVKSSSGSDNPAFIGDLFGDLFAVLGGTAG